MTVAGWTTLGVAFACALVIAADELRASRSQPMWIMNVVHPVTALYWGPAWVWVYVSRRALPVAKAVSHCGAGCTLGDIAGEWLLFSLGVKAFGWELFADFAFAWTLGIAFQYFSGADGIRAAIRTDTLSIVAFQAGLFAWMALAHSVIWQPPLPVDSSGHWLSMQVGMMVGFFTAWPANVWLLRRGWKEEMR